MKTILLLLLATLSAAPLLAKEELVTLPERDSVQLTIYNSEDLTLVRERRSLVFKEGANRLQFSWANTLIDPTSVEFKALSNADKLEVLEVPQAASEALTGLVERGMQLQATIQDGVLWLSGEGGTVELTVRPPGGSSA